MVVSVVEVNVVEVDVVVVVVVVEVVLEVEVVDFWSSLHVDISASGWKV